MKLLRTRGWKPDLPWIVFAWREAPEEESGKARTTQSAPTYDAGLEKAAELIRAGWTMSEVREAK